MTVNYSCESQRISEPYQKEIHRRPTANCIEDERSFPDKIKPLYRKEEEKIRKTRLQENNFEE